jgi:hypothetical protein
MTLERTVPRLFLAVLAVGMGCSSEQPAPVKSGPCDVPSGPERYRKTLGAKGDDHGLAVAMRADRSVVVGGTHDANGAKASWLAGISAHGEVEWELASEGLGTRVVALGPNDVLAVDLGFTGRSVSASGKQIWAKSWESTANPALEVPNAALVLTDGYLVVGTRLASTAENASRKARLLRLDGTGEVVWDLLEGNDSENTANAVAALGDGDFVTVGHSAAPSGDVGRQVWLRAADSDGTKSWEKRHGGPLEEIGYGVSVLQDKSLLVAASTRSKGAGQNDLWLLKTSAQGYALWDKTFGGESNDDPRALGVMTDGSALVVGRHTSEEALPGGLWLLRIDTNGKLLWEQTYGRAWLSEGRGIAVVGDEYAAIGTTELNGAGGDDVWLLRGGPSGKAWCDGNVGAPCKGAGAETCVAATTCDLTMKPPMCAAK